MPPAGRCSPTPRLALAVARGSGPAVAQLGAVARQDGVPVSLHGTGGAWLVAAPDADATRFAAAVEHSLDRKVCNTLNVCCIAGDRPDLVEVFHAAAGRAAARRQRRPGRSTSWRQTTHALAVEWEWDDVPEVSLVRGRRRRPPRSPRSTATARDFVATLISEDAAAHDAFYAAVDVPFVGDGFTRWVDGQFALDQPELGLSNWQNGRLFARGGVLSGDSVHTVRLRARIVDADLHR